MANLQVAVPKNAEPVKLFYVGGFVETVENMKGEIVPNRPIVTAYGSSFVVPKKGQSLTVPKYVAKRLIERNRTPQGQSVFTTDAKLAKIMTEGGQIVTQVAQPPMELTKEELLERLAELEAKELKTPVKRNKKEEGEE